MEANVAPKAVDYLVVNFTLWSHPVEHQQIRYCKNNLLYPETQPRRFGGKSNSLARFQSNLIFWSLTTPAFSKATILFIWKTGFIQNRARVLRNVFTSDSLEVCWCTRTGSEARDKRLFMLNYLSGCSSTKKEEEEAYRVSGEAKMIHAKSNEPRDLKSRAQRQVQ